MALFQFQLFSMVVGILAAYFALGMVVYFVVAFGLNKWDSVPDANSDLPLDDSNQKQIRYFIESLSELKGPELGASQMSTLKNIFKNIHEKKAG